MSASMTRRAALGAVCSVAFLAGSGSPWAQSMPKIVVTKDPTCGCCGGWVDHLRASGFSAEVIESSELNRIKARLGMLQDLASCHTGEIGG